MNSVIAAKRLLLRVRGQGLGAQLLRGTIGSVLLKVGFILLSFSLTVVLARLLEPEGYGVYAHALAVVMVIAVPAQVGLPTLLVREIARYRTTEEWSLMRGVLRWTNRVVLIMSGVLAGVAGIVIGLYADNLEAHKLATYLWAMLLIPLITLGNLRGAALRGLHQVLAGQLPEQILRPGLLLILLLGILSINQAWLEPDKAMGLHALAAAGAFVVGLILLRRAMPVQAGKAMPEYESRPWMRSMIPLSLIAGMQVINSQLALVVLGFVATDAAVGIYRVAAQIAMLVAFTLTAVNMVLAPTVARLYAQNDREQMQRLVTWSARLVLAAALPVVAVFVIFGETVLRIMFGEDYVGAYAALIILSIGQLINASMGSVGLILNMTGHERTTLAGMALGASVNIFLALLLIPPFGIEGAAVATALSLITWNIILCWQTYRRVGIISTAIIWR